jgi:Ser/Thr protein kinase RdoA (MazF antagonist)
MPTSSETEVHPWGEKGPAVGFAADVDAGSRGEIERVLSGWTPSLLPGGRVEVSNLVGGASNRNFIVRTARVKYALRIANAQSERFAVDRAMALQAQREAAAAGLAPEPLASRLPEGHVLSTFVEGPTLGGEVLHAPGVLGTVGSTLRQLHALPSSLPVYSPFEDIRLWSRLARSDETAIPAELEQLFGEAGRIEAVVERAGLPTVFCHNDPWTENFILSGSRLALVDWDYAGRGWACFELGSFCATAGLDAGEREALVRAYDENPSEAQLATVDLMGFVAAVREATWAVMATPILRGTMTPVDGDDFYDNHLRTFLGLARERAASADFGRLIGVASDHSKSRTW